MATSFPTSLDNLTNPTSSDAMNSATVPHAAQHANANDAIEALEAKVGIDGSAVSTSLDYKTSKSTTLTAPAAATTPLTIKGAASQSADLLKIQNSASTGLVEVDASGRVLVGPQTDLAVGGTGLLQVAGTGSSQVWVGRFSADATNAAIYGVKSRGVTIGSHGLVQSGDDTLQIASRASDGTNWVENAAIKFSIDGTPGTNDMPGRIVFFTTADGAAATTERMRIANDGRITIPAGGVLEAPLTQNAQTGTTYTLVLGDADKLVELSNTLAITLTIPTNSTAAFPIGTKINIVQTNSGQVTVSPAGTVTLNTPANNTKVKLNGQWAVATLVKRATNTWLMFGDITA